MRFLISTLLAAAIFLPAAPTPVEAGVMSRACITSDRKAKSRKLCNCMQSVANQRLSRRDQKMAASFFKDPHKAQEIRQSDNRSHEQFWKRYKEFGAVFAASCSHLN